MLDLYNKLYSREELKKNIYSVSLVDIIKTQKLDESFICKYILNSNYQLTEEESKIDICMILHYQRHINLKSLNKWIEDNQYNIKCIRKRMDSIDNFDSLL